MNVIKSVSADFTEQAGRKYAANLKPGSVTGLFGDLGSGKTRFVKGICSYFNADNLVTSPTFIIKNEYPGKDPATGKPVLIYHYDLYRISNLNELTELGLNDFDNENSLCLIEWAELAEEYFRGNLNRVFFDYGEKENERTIKII
ncbi:MAG: tRNA (adenosine(37)-N6)-threonylcarbamoyltransferase complex ATPase subunit type 1 TsaE [Bacteroidetes bacterium]|nr:tRNA (adenosine(37)-N6)-threonylcarbamoyltransferase complex ATPase subunit type 1 TsaE [Bacteroidota bacterium]